MLADHLTQIFKTIKAETAKSISELLVKDESADLDKTQKSNLENINVNVAEALRTAEEKLAAEIIYADVEYKVKEWNLNYPVGTKVKSTVMDYDLLETRTEAVVLFGHRAAVYVKDYNGYFDLDELAPA